MNIFAGNFSYFLMMDVWTLTYVSRGEDFYELWYCQLLSRNKMSVYNSCNSIWEYTPHFTLQVLTFKDIFVSLKSKNSALYTFLILLTWILLLPVNGFAHKKFGLENTLILRWRNWLNQLILVLRIFHLLFLVTSVTAFYSGSLIH